MRKQESVQKQQLGALLKKARLTAELTLADISRRTDMTTGQLSWIETGKRADPRFSTMANLRQALGISLDDLADILYGKADSVADGREELTP